jgi:hypothetical protein
MGSEPADTPIAEQGNCLTMNRFSPFRGVSLGLFKGSKALSRDHGKRRRPARHARMEWLEERQLLTWVATFVNSTGALTIQGVGLSSDTGVVKIDPGSGEILLDGNNSGNFADTGANLATISTTIQIQANTTVNSNFVIDNNAGAFFEAPPSFLSTTPLFNYTGSTAFEPNTSLTIRGKAGVADTFTVTPDKAIQNMGQVLLTEPPNQLNQQNSLLVSYGPDPLVPNSTGLTGHLALDGIDGQGGSDKLIINDRTGVASDWTLNGSTIAGPQFPPLPTVPPAPPILPGTVGDITYSNIGNLQFNNVTSGDLLTINSVAAPTAASAVVASTTVVNYKQPLAFSVSLIGLPAGTTTTTTGTGVATLDLVGAPGGNNDFYIDAQSVALAATGTKPQYNVPFAHLGADLTYTPGSMKTLQVAGNGGNNIFTVQVPPTLIAPFPSNTLPSNFVVYSGSLPPVIAGTPPTFVSTGTSNLLRVLGNDPGPGTNGADTISVSDLAAAANGTNAGNNIQMSGIQGVVIYGEGGDDTLTNNSMGIPAQGIKPVSAMLIGGDGNDTLTGGGGSDMLLGGNGQNTLTGGTATTTGGTNQPPPNPQTTYYFPHQDQFGNIYDQLLDPSVGDTTSTLKGAGGNQVVVTGAVDPVLSADNVDPITNLGLGDLDLGNLANASVAGGTTGGGTTVSPQTISVATVPPSNVTAPLYMVTPALTALEQAMGVSRGPYPANPAALLEFGGNVNLRSQFATYAAFVGRAYDDFMVGRGGGGTFAPLPNAQKTGNGLGGNTSFGPEGSSLVSQPEIQYWVDLGQRGVTVQQMQAQLLSSDELRQTLPGSDMWVRFLYQSVTGQLPSNAELTAATNQLAASDTAATRYNIALNLLTSPAGQAAEIRDMYANVVPSGGSPSPANLAAIQSDLAAGESLPQVAQILSASNGDYLNYETTHNLGIVGFVSHLYQAVLQRPAAPGDLSFWSAAAGQGLSKAQIALSILNSPEARNFVIQDAYQSYLGRPVDASGLSFWQAQLAGGLSDEQFVSLIIGSQEYYNKNGGTSSSYIQALYHDLLQRTAPPSQQEIDFWVAQLAMSTRGAVQARADIALAFQHGDEFDTLLIDRWYQAFDGRAPSATELNSALSLFHSGASQESVEAQILAAQSS